MEASAPRAPPDDFPLQTDADAAFAYLPFLFPYLLLLRLLLSLSGLEVRVSRLVQAVRCRLTIAISMPHRHICIPIEAPLEIEELRFWAGGLGGETEERTVLMTIDMHGHSRAKNVFIYGLCCPAR
jgi:hypothetical protein